MMRFRLLLCLTFLMAAGSALAAQRELTFSLAHQGSMDTNPNVTTSNAKDLYGSVTTPKIMFSSKTPTSYLDTNAAVTQNLFNLKGYSTTDVNGGVTIGRRMEKWEISAAGTGTYDSSRTSELTTLGLNTGNVRHASFSVAPTLAYIPSELDRITVSGSYLKSSYNGSAFVDYHVLSATTNYVRALAPKHSALVGVNVRRYGAESGLERRVDSISPTVGWLSSLTPRFKARLSVGTQASRETIKNAPDLDWQWSSVYEGSLTFKGEQHTTSFTTSRSQQPYINGNEDLLTSFILDETYKLNTLVSLSFFGAYHFGESSARNGGNLKSRWEAQPGLAYHLYPELDLTTSYRYRREELYNREAKATAHIARIGLLWKPELDPKAW